METPEKIAVLVRPMVWARRRGRGLGVEDDIVVYWVV